MESMHFLQVTEDLRKLGKISRFKNKHNNAYNVPGRKSVANKMRNICFRGQRPGMSFKTQSSPPKFPGALLGKKDSGELSSKVGLGCTITIPHKLIAGVLTR